MLKIIQILINIKEKIIKNQEQHRLSTYRTASYAAILPDDHQMAQNKQISNLRGAERIVPEYSVLTYKGPNTAEEPY